MPILRNSSKEIIREANSSFTNGKYGDAVKYLESLLLLVPKGQAIYGQILANLAVARSYLHHHSQPAVLWQELQEALRHMPFGVHGALSLERLDNELSKIRSEHCCVLKNLATLHWYTACWRESGHSDDLQQEHEDSYLCMVSTLAERLDTLGAAHMSTTFCELWSLLVQEHALHTSQTLDQLLTLKKRLYPLKNEAVSANSRYKFPQEVNKLRFSLRTLTVVPTLALPVPSGQLEVPGSSVPAPSNSPLAQVDVQQLEVRIRTFMGSYPVEQQVKGLDTLLLAQLAYLKSDYVKALQLLVDAPTETPNGSEKSEEVTSLQAQFTKYEQSERLLVLNNRACCLILLGKPHLAHLFPFQDALRLASLILKEKVSAAFDTSPDVNNAEEKSLPDEAQETSTGGCGVARVHHVAQDALHYNAAVALLLANQPRLAFEYFVQVAQRHTTNPRLWFRLAQCCVRHHENCRLQGTSETKVPGKVSGGPERHAEMPVLDLRHHYTTQTRDVWQLLWWQGAGSSGPLPTQSGGRPATSRKDTGKGGNEGGGKSSRQSQRRQQDTQNPPLHQRELEQSLLSEVACVPAANLHFGAMCIVSGLACLPLLIKDLLASMQWPPIALQTSEGQSTNSSSAANAAANAQAVEQKRRALLHWLRESGDAIVVKTSPGHGLRAADAVSLAAGLLCEGAYLHLVQGQHPQCVSYSRQLWHLMTAGDPPHQEFPSLLSLAYPRRSIRRQLQQVTLLSQQYMSEALVAQGHSGLAVTLLQNALVTLNEAKLTQATLPLFVNLCVALVHDGKLQQASQMLRNITKELTEQRIPWPKELGKMYFYLDLRVSSGRHLCKWRLPGFS